MSCRFRILLLVGLSLVASSAAAEEAVRVDWLTLGRGVRPVAIEGDGPALRVEMEKALQAIDGHPGGYSLTPKPGGEATEVAFVFELPAPTTFTDFAIPNVLETPSPSQTFFREIQIEGSSASATGPFELLAQALLETHGAKGESTALSALEATPVRWVRLRLRGGIDVQRDKTFFEFSEIEGFGSQEATPLSEHFHGKWKGRGVSLELAQEGPRVSGCYDRVGDLEGTVSGNILRATGKTRDGGIPSSFLLMLDGEGALVGVRSTNGAPFRLYTAAPAPDIDLGCPAPVVTALGCGSIVHGIQFDFDSAQIREESGAILDALAEGLAKAPSESITVVGHTSSEGTEEYNADLSHRRAEAVMGALVARGIEEGRIASAGRGETEPIADNGTEAGRSLNRRVEIVCP